MHTDTDSLKGKELRETTPTYLRRQNREQKYHASCPCFLEAQMHPQGHQAVDWHLHCLKPLLHPLLASFELDVLASRRLQFLFSFYCLLQRNPIRSSASTTISISWLTQHCMLLQREINMNTGKVATCCYYMWPETCLGNFPECSSRLR